MILKKIEKQVDGEMKTEWMLTEAQTTFLLNFAISNLLQAGLVQVLTETLEGKNEEELSKKFLAEVDPNSLHKA
jgi:hypothetical protein